MLAVVNNNFCINSSSIWQLIGYFLFVLKVVVPLIIIILGIIDLVKAIPSSKDEEVSNAAKMLAIRFAIGVAIFFVPTIISIIFDFVKGASPYIANADACQSCLLKPFVDDCANYVATAKKIQADKNDELSQSKDDDYYEVYIESCYYCVRDKEYVWTSSPECGERVYIQKYKTQEACEEANSLGKPLTKDQVAQMHAEMETPTYQELLDLAQKNYGMSEEIFKVVFGWAINEGYDGAKNVKGEIDTYLGYLCDCIGINYYMGYELKSADELARKIAGGDESPYYFVSNLTNKVNTAINNPKAYAPQFKGMYLALKYPDVNVHNCYGPLQSEQNLYKSNGGEIYYQGEAYPRAPTLPIQVWTLWYSGIKNWQEEK